MTTSTQLGKTWTKKGNDVYEVVNNQLGPSLSYQDFMSKYKSQGLNLDIIPQWKDPSSIIHAPYTGTVFGKEVNLEYLTPTGTLEQAVTPSKIPEIPSTEVPKKTSEIVQGGETYNPPTPAAPTVSEAYINSMLETLEKQRLALENMYKTQQANAKTEKDTAQKKQDELIKKQEDILTENVQPLTTAFRSDLEKSERERLSVEKNYADNQKLTDELDTLLTNINAELQAAKNVTGLASIRNPRIAQATEEMTARVGVIEATMAARNNQITVANNLIDRTVTAMTADRNDQLNYYNSLLNFYDSQAETEGEKVSTASTEEKKWLENQVSLIENDLKTTQTNVDYIKNLMLDPNYATLAAQSGVTLNDTPTQVQEKFAKYYYNKEVTDTGNEMSQNGYNFITPEEAKTKPEGSVITQTDSKGVVRNYYKPLEVTETWSEPYKLGGDWVQKNTKTGEIRTAVNVPSGTTTPQTTIVEANGRRLLIDKATGATIKDLGKATTGSIWDILGGGETTPEETPEKNVTNLEEGENWLDRAKDWYNNNLVK